MPHRDIIVMGASAGGIDAFREILRVLPEKFPASIFIVLHIPADAPSRLPAILGRDCAMPVVSACDGDRIQRGRVYIAPPDHHLVVHHSRIRVVRGPRENRHRPAIDPLFRSAAKAFGPRVIAVLLSGLLDDGSSGLQVVHSRGGLSIVQDPDEAEFSMMPHNAVEYDSPDWIVPVSEVGPLLLNLVRESVPDKDEKKETDELKEEVGVAEMNMDALEAERDGEPSVFACPECKGVLWEVKDGDLVRYRCRVGHAYSSESLRTAQAEDLEGALWSALRALEESAAMSRRMADWAKDRGRDLTYQRLDEDAQEKQQQANIVRDMLLSKEVDKLPQEEAKPRTGTNG